MLCVWLHTWRLEHPHLHSECTAVARCQKPWTLACVLSLRIDAVLAAGGRAHDVSCRTAECDMLCTRAPPAAGSAGMTDCTGCGGRVGAIGAKGGGTPGAGSAQAAQPVHRAHLQVCATSYGSCPCRNGVSFFFHLCVTSVAHTLQAGTASRPGQHCIRLVNGQLL